LEDFIMNMACELNDMELDAVSGGTYKDKAPKPAHQNFHFKNVTFIQGNTATASGGSATASGDNTIAIGNNG
jgi:hypothetical protein